MGPWGKVEEDEKAQPLSDRGGGSNVLSKDNEFESDKEKTRWRKLGLLCSTTRPARRSGVGRE